MGNSDAPAELRRLLQTADIEINGTRPWDLQVHDERFYPALLRRGTLGLGEAYMAGWWDCAELDVLFCKAMQSHLDRQVDRRVRSGG